MSIYRDPFYRIIYINMSIHYSDSPLHTQQPSPSADRMSPLQLCSRKDNFFRHIFRLCCKPTESPESDMEKRPSRDRQRNNEQFQLEPTSAMKKNQRKQSDTEDYFQKKNPDNPEYQILSWQDEQILTQWINTKLPKRPLETPESALCAYLKNLPLVKQSYTVCLFHYAQERQLLSSFQDQQLVLISKLKEKLRSIESEAQQSYDEAFSIGEDSKSSSKVIQKEVVLGVKRMKCMGLFDSILVVPQLEVDHIDQEELESQLRYSFEILKEQPMEILEKTLFILPSKMNNIKEIFGQFWAKQLQEWNSQNSQRQQQQLSRSSNHYFKKPICKLNSRQCLANLKRNDSQEIWDSPAKSIKCFYFLQIQGLALSSGNDCKYVVVTIKKQYHSQGDQKFFEEFESLYQFLGSQIFFKSQLVKLSESEQQMLDQMLMQTSIPSILCCIQKLEFNQLQYQRLKTNPSFRQQYITFLQDAGIIQSQVDFDRLQKLLQFNELSPIPFVISSQHLNNSAKVIKQSQNQIPKGRSKSQSIDLDEIDSWYSQIVQTPINQEYNIIPEESYDQQ